MLHPSLRQLLRFQMVARFHRMADRFRRPRRLVLSIIAVALACLWLGQAILGILFRPPADPQRLAEWIPVALAAYAWWHVFKVVIRSPVEPFEWTPTEKELLWSAPLSRKDLVHFRLAGILLPAAIKALCFALVMIPDLHVFSAGCLGMFLALLGLDLIRMLAEIVTYGVKRRTFLWVRGAVLALAAGVGLRAIVATIAQPEIIDSPHAFLLGGALVKELVAMSTTPWGCLLMMPFEVFSRVILASSVGPHLLADVGTALVLVGGLMAGAQWLDRRLYFERVKRERCNFVGDGLDDTTESHHPRPVKLDTTTQGPPKGWRQPLSFGGAASLAWRQAWGARKYEVSVLVALLVPGILSLLPLLGSTDNSLAAVQMSGSLIFYSLVLLSAAFKFDFRRDLDRLVVLKALPVSAWATVVGQVTVPVALCTLFQLSVMLIGMCCRPFSVTMLSTAICLMTLANCLIFALENLVFLWYPYRLNKEGVDVFLRSIIVLTAKTVLFACGLALTLGWAYVAARCCGPELLGHVFFAGMALTLLGCCVLVLTLLVRVYRAFDPSQDVPAMS